MGNFAQIYTIITDPHLIEAHRNEQLKKLLDNDNTILSPQEYFSLCLLAISDKKPDVLRILVENPKAEAALLLGGDYLYHLALPHPEIAAILKINCLPHPQSINTILRTKPLMDYLNHSREKWLKKRKMN